MTAMLDSPFVTYAPFVRGRVSQSSGSYASGVFPLPTDPIGSATVTFSGIQANTEIRVYLPDGTALAGVEDCVANQQLSWPVYPPGANSTVTIRLINLAYKSKEFDYTPVVGTQSLPVQQERDQWYRNPI